MPCNGYVVDGMKKINRQLINYFSESTKTLHTERAWYCAAANAEHLVIKVIHLVQDPF